MRIVFMGTPEFAVPSLQVLYEAEYDIVGVVTAPDRPKGRGKKLATSAVKDYAVQHGLTVLQPLKLKSEDFLDQLRSLKADLQVVVAFRMLPEVVWNMPPMGTINLHGSLLPKYRGAAPINWAIINGETETGVTTFFLKHAIDTGNIIFQEHEPISANDNVGSLYERLMVLGGKLVLKTVRAIESGEYHEIEQNQSDAGLPVAPKIHKETCEIDWSKDATTIVNFVRGLSPYPAAWTSFQGKKFKIFDTEEARATLKTSSNTGDLETDNKSFLYIQTGNGVVAIKELQPEGKKRMAVTDFFRGNKI